MRRFPWALALLALSLPAPALSDPLRLSIHDAVWDRRPSDATTAARDLSRAWWRERDEADDEAFDNGPLPTWRGRNAIAPFDRYDNGDDSRADEGYRYGGTPDRTGTPGWGPGWRPGRPYPLSVLPATPQPVRRCGPGAALVGAAIGGGLGAALSDGSRQRQWALPIGATVGGLLAGVLAGC